MPPRESAIAQKLIAMGRKYIDGPRERVEFAGVEEADDFLNDLDRNPHAFVLACLMDRQMKAEKAWLIPYKLKEKLGDFSMSTLEKLEENDIKRLMSEPKPMHRFVDIMSNVMLRGIKRISILYRGDASRIWSDTPSSSTVIYRFLEFNGVGPKIATMATNILARHFKVPFSDYISIDVSADVHVRRVFHRLGLTPPEATVEQLVYRARGLSPEFPGLLDYPAWEIGRNWCHAHKPECEQCYMNHLCASAS